MNQLLALLFLEFFNHFLNINMGVWKMGLLGSITIISLFSYFLMACLYFVTKKWSGVKRFDAILSFAFWLTSIIALTYFGVQATAGQHIVTPSLWITIFAFGSMLVLGKAFLGYGNTNTSTES